MKKAAAVPLLDNELRGANAPENASNDAPPRNVPLVFSTAFNRMREVMRLQNRMVHALELERDPHQPWFPKGWRVFEAELKDGAIVREINFTKRAHELGLIAECESPQPPFPGLET